MCLVLNRHRHQKFRLEVNRHRHLRHLYLKVFTVLFILNFFTLDKGPSRTDAILSGCGERGGGLPKLTKDDVGGGRGTES